MGSGNPALRGLKRRDPGGKRGIRYTLLQGRKQFPPLQLGSFTRSNICKEYIENKQGIKHNIREQPINIFKTMKKTKVPAKKAFAGSTKRTTKLATRIVKEDDHVRRHGLS